MFLKPAPDAHERVVRPVVTGKFSEVDRDYVKTYYTRKKADGTLSVNWLILNRDPIMRALLEDWLNPTKYWGAYVRIPEDAEVASKPSYSREMFSPPS